MKTHNLPLWALLFSLVLFVACDPEEPGDGPEPELITTLNYTLTPTDGEVVVLTFQDPDGDGGDAPVISSGTLSANTTYVGTIELLNESVDPVEDITEEVEEEDEEHQFFFMSTVAGLTVDYADQDEDDNPVGLTSSLTTGDASTGTLTINLIHEPQKDADGVATGDISNAGGESDIEVTFSIVVQ